MSLHDIFKSVVDAKSLGEFPPGTFENVEYQRWQIGQAIGNKKLPAAVKAQVDKELKKAYYVAMGADRRAELAVLAAIETIETEAQAAIDRAKHLLLDNGIALGDL